MTNSIQLPAYASAEETDALHQAMVMQKFLGFFEELNADSDDFAKTLKTAFLAMAKVHPNKAEEALSTYATIADLLRMSVENHETFVELSNNYYDTQKAIEDREQVD